MKQNKVSDKKDESKDGEFLPGDFYLGNVKIVLRGLGAYYLNLKDSTQKEEMAFKLWDILSDLPVGLMRRFIKGWVVSEKNETEAYAKTREVENETK